MVDRPALMGHSITIERSTLLRWHPAAAEDASVIPLPKVGVWQPVLLSCRPNLQHDAGTLVTGVEVREDEPVGFAAVEQRGQALLTALGLGGIHIRHAKTQVEDTFPVFLEEAPLWSIPFRGFAQMQLDVAEVGELETQAEQVPFVGGDEVVRERLKRREVLPRANSDRLVEGGSAIEVADHDADVVEVLKDRKRHGISSKPGEPAAQHAGSCSRRRPT